VAPQARECVSIGDLVYIAEQDECVRSSFALEVATKDGTLLVLPIPHPRHILVEVCHEVDDLVRPRKETLPVLLEDERLLGAGESPIPFDQDKPVDEVSELAQACFE
jgi:hypothetical protein